MDVCLETFLLLHYNKGIQYLHDYHYLTPEIVPSTLPAVSLKLAGKGPKVWRARDLQDSHRGSQQKYLQITEAVLCPPVPTRRLGPGLGQQPNPSLEADLVMEVVNHLGKVGAIILC